MFVRYIRGTTLVAAVLLAGVSTGRANEVSPELLKSWEAGWNWTANQLTRNLLDQVGKQYLLTLERDERSRLRAELLNVMRPEISWERLGDSVVESMVSACGTELLDDIVTTRVSGDKAPPELQEAYSACYGTVMNEARVAAAQAILAKEEELRTVFRLFGVDPNAKPVPPGQRPGTTPALVAIWAADWKHRMNPIIDEFITSFEEPLFQALEPEDAASALTEIRATIESAVGWEGFSHQVEESIVYKCDRTLLEAVGPYLTSGVRLSDAEEDLSIEYADCYDAAISEAQQLALYGLVTDARVQAAFAKHNDAFTSHQRISPVVTTAAVEAQYGALLDEIIALHGMSAPEAQQQAVDRLKSRLQEDPAVIHVSLEDPGHAHGVYGQLFYFYQDGESPPGTSCHGVSPPEQARLTRCSWESDRYGHDNVISYSREFVYAGEKLAIGVAFDYDALLRALGN